MGWAKWLAKIPKHEFITKFSRSSGPGGQNVNKVSSKAQIRLHRHTLAAADWVDPEVKTKLWADSPYATKTGDILIASELTRSQKNNLEDCFVKLAKEVERLSFVPATPSKDGREKWDKLRMAEKRKKKEIKLKHSQKKQDRRLV